MPPPSLCETIHLLAVTSRSYFNAAIEAQREYEHGAPQRALVIFHIAVKQLEANITLIEERLASDLSVMGQRIVRRIRAVLAAVKTEIANAKIQDTIHAYRSILTFDLVEIHDANVLESLVLDCEKLRNSTLACDICIKCPRCGGQGNAHCEFPGTHGEHCIRPTSS